MENKEPSELGQAELFPCPFCGGAAREDFSIHLSERSIYFAWVECENGNSCGCTIKMNGCYDKEYAVMSARRAWNRRAPSDPSGTDSSSVTRETDLEEPGDVAANTVLRPMVRTLEKAARGLYEFLLSPDGDDNIMDIPDVVWIPFSKAIADPLKIKEPSDRLNLHMVLDAVFKLRVAVKAVIRRYELGASQHYGIELLETALRDTEEAGELRLSLQESKSSGASRVSSEKDLSGFTCAGRRKACRKTSATHTGGETQAPQSAQSSPSSASAVIEEEKEKDLGERRAAR